MPVRRGLRDRGRGECAAGAGAVFDDDRLAPALTQGPSDHARRDVGRAAGRKRHDDADRPLREPPLRGCSFRRGDYVCRGDACKEGWPAGAFHSTWMLAILTTLRYLSISTRTKRLNSSGVLPTPSSPWVRNCCFMSGRSTTRAISLLICSMTGRGVLAGANTPNHAWNS